MSFDLIRLRLSSLGQFFFYQHGSQVATKHDLIQCIYKFSLSKTEKQRKAVRMSLFLLHAHQSHFSKEKPYCLTDWDILKQNQVTCCLLDKLLTETL